MVKLKIDPAEFQAELKRLVSVLRNDERGAARIINAEAYHLAKETLDRTRRARRASIEALGMTTKTAQQYTTSKGFTRTKRTFNFNRPLAVQNYLAALIHNKGGQAANDYLRSKITAKHQRKQALRAAEGKSVRALTQGHADNELGQMARRWIGKKLRSIGFLASTWRTVVRKFDRYAGQKAGLVSAGGEIKKGNNNDVSISGTKLATGRDMTAVLALKIGRDKYGNYLRDYAAKLMRDALQLALNARRDIIRRRIGYELKEQLRKERFAVK